MVSYPFIALFILANEVLTASSIFIRTDEVSSSHKPKPNIASFITKMESDAMGKRRRQKMGKEDQLLSKKILSKSKFLRRADSSSSYDDAFTTQDDGYDYSDTFFDLSQFSVKFHSCASLSSFDFDDFEFDESKNSEDETFPYTSTQVVNYRLCPSDTCQDDSWKGCRNVYGNYTITLEDYFEAKKEYEEHLEEVMCEYCEECEYFYKKYNEKCDDYDKCSNYTESLCKDKKEDEVDYSDYLDCKKVDVKETEEMKKKMEEAQKKKEEAQKKKEEAKKEREERRKEGFDDDYYEEEEDEMEEWEKSGKVYLNVYCDGSLKVGIFSDNKCSKYIGDQISITSITDLSIDEDDLKDEFKDKDCISCSKFNSYCKDMYDDSVKCNANLVINEKEYSNKELEKWEKTTSESTCSLIEKVQKGLIDQYGFISSSSSSPYDTNSTSDTDDDDASSEPSDDGTTGTTDDDEDDEV